MLTQPHLLRAIPTAAIFPIPEAERSSILDRDLIGFHEFIDGVEGAGFADNLKEERDGGKEGRRSKGEMRLSPTNCNF
jgi:hypothetical protein